MKNLLFTFCALLICVVSLAQDKKTYQTVGTVKSADSKGMPVSDDKKSNQEVKQEKTEPVIIQTLEYKVDEKGNPTYTDSNIPSTPNANTSTTVEAPAKSIDEQIADIDANIAAIDSKVEWVKSHPKQHQNAMDTGWYTQMEESKQSLLDKKQELLNSKK